jgi:hypothetical protein
MSNNQKILKEIHCRYNFYISTQAHLSNLYVGYVNKDNQIDSRVVDLFLTFLYKINFPNPEKTQEYLYNQIEKHINNKEKLNILFIRFKNKVKECKFSDYRDNKDWRKFMDNWDIRKQRPQFNWEQWDKIRKKHSNLFNKKTFTK